MVGKTSLLLVSVAVAVSAQQVGTNTPEVHPALTTEQCTSSGCTTENTAIVIDANWRWTHNVGGYTNCYTGDAWDPTLCPDGKTCAENCAVEGASYESTYGITTTGNEVTLGFVTQGASKNVGSRVYLMADESHYQMFNPINREFTFDVDVSALPCGINGALYFTQMDADGGLAKYPTNKAGAQYGTGYCDAQCPKDIKFIDGMANVAGWTPSSNDPTSGTGMYGSCCNEMDVWEANQFATAYTPHPCSVDGQYMCSGDECGEGAARYDGLCDASGCDSNPYRQGNHTFYGPGLTIDTTKPFTVVTQFITSDGTDTGTLTEIKRSYIQDDVVIPNADSNTAGIDPVNYIDDAYCTQQNAAFDGAGQFNAKGGLTTMQKSFDAGVVLVMSVWDDHLADCLWLDSTYPTNATADTPGANRGPCATTTGDPSQIEGSDPGAYVKFSNIRFGEIGSTTKGGGSSPPPPAPPSSSSTSTTGSPTTSSPPQISTTATAAGSQQTHYGQCGGSGYTGPTVCAPPYQCTYSSQYYSQCN